MMSNWTQSTLESPTGASLNLYSAVTGDKPRAIVQINHGMGEHAARYQRFADFLNGRGYGVYAHDHRGHGETSSLDAHPGHFASKDGWDKVVEDVLAVNSHIRQKHPGVPIICFGHSMGSIIGFSYALRHPGTIDALVCWNAGFTTGLLATVGKAILKIERMFKGSDVPSNITRKLTFDAWNGEFKPNRTEFDWLSRDEVEVDKYVNDPYCGIPISIGLWLDVLSGIYFNADNANLAVLPNNLPVHLQGGAADPCSEHGKAVAAIAPRLRKAGLKDVTLNILEDTRHESLNEVNRDEVMAGFADWCDQRFGG
jgi:alpha-beta hydrolase superfamily lysophospholipase